MATDHACQTAIAEAAEGLAPLPGHPADQAGLCLLLEALDGLQADLTGRLAHWHAGLGERLSAALAPPGDGGHRRQTRPPDRRPAPQPASLDAVASVQGRSQEVLTVLLSRPRPDHRVAAAELTVRLTLVQDAVAGALRRNAVPAEAAVRCAVAVTTAAGSLFGARPAPLPDLPEAPPQAAPPVPERPAPPAPGRTPGQLPDWLIGLP